MMPRIAALAFFLITLPRVAALAPRYLPKVKVDVAVGTTWKRISPSKARLARTGQKKVYFYELYLKQLNGPKDAIRQVEFFPDFIDNTYQPESYIKTFTAKDGVFSTSHDCWGASTALLKATMMDGSVKTLKRRIRFGQDATAEHTNRLLAKPFHRATGRGFGVELEMLCPPDFRPGLLRNVIKKATGEECLVPGYSTTTTKAWKVSTDNTINVPNGYHGVEVVSPILRGEAGLTKFCNTVSAIDKYGADVTANCGLHVHMDLQGIKFEGLKKICMNWVKYESAIDLMIDETRRDSKNEYCLNVRENMRFKEKSLDQVLHQIDTQTSPTRLVNLMNAHPHNRNRYFKLNLQNLVSNENPRNTIEFRGHEATMDPVWIENWIRFLDLFIQASVEKPKPKPFGSNTTSRERLKRLLQKFVKDEELDKFYRL